MKLLIFGIVASGKTTLAKALSCRLGIPWYEGDCIAWVQDKKTRYKRTPQEQQEVIRRLDAEGDWIVEGCYRESQKILFDLADRVIFLDPPLHVRKRRIFTRYVKQKLGLEACHYKPDRKLLRCMYQWTREFEEERGYYEEILKVYENKLVRVKSKRQLVKVLETGGL